MFLASRLPRWFSDLYRTKLDVMHQVMVMVCDEFFWLEPETVVDTTTPHIPSPFDIVLITP